MVVVLAPVDGLSLWESGPRGDTALMAHAGDPLSAADSNGTQHDDLLEFPVPSAASPPRAVLVAAAAPEEHAWAVPVLERAVSALGAVLERSSLLESCSDQES